MECLCGGVTQDKRDALRGPRGAAKSVKVVVWATQRPRWRRLAGCNGEVEAAVRVESPDEPKT